jgi:hypothetical protein
MDQPMAGRKKDLVMSQDIDERDRAHLRLVVNNGEKRSPRPSAGLDDFITLDDLVAGRDAMSGLFYRDMERRYHKVYGIVERFLTQRGWPYGLDPHHGKPLVIPAVIVCPEAVAYGMDPRDEVLVFVSDDAADKGLCFSLEMILPYYSDDESVMEDALLYSPVFQYGALFIEENRQDGLLDLVYRLGIPLYPPALTGKILDRFFSIAAREVSDALRVLAEQPDN